MKLTRTIEIMEQLDLLCKDFGNRDSANEVSYEVMDDDIINLKFGWSGGVLLLIYNY